MTDQMTREDTHRRFVTRFCNGRAETVTAAALDQAEDQLGVLFPNAYRAFVLAHGAARSQTLLGLIVRAEANLWDLALFHTPSECVEATETYRSGGMSERLIVFASDSSGNVFCFDENDLLDARLDDARVWLFDHDFNEDKPLSDSFDGWLLSYFSLS